MDMKFKKVSFHDNEILFGRDSTPFITAVEFDGENVVEIFFRKRNEVTSKKESFKPFIFLEDTIYMDGWSGTYEAKRLKGSAHYKYLVLTESWSDLQRLLKHFKKTTGATPASLSAPFFYLNDPVHQYLLFQVEHFLKKYHLVICSGFSLILRRIVRRDMNFQILIGMKIELR